MRRGPALAIVLVGLGLIASAPRAQDAPVAATNPLGNPGHLALFPSQSLGLLNSRNATSYAYLTDLSATSGDLQDWRLEVTALDPGSLCAATPRRRLASGRVASATADHAVCMTNFHVEVLGVSPPLSYRFARPGTGTSRDFDLAVGDMVLEAEDDGHMHQEVVVAYRDLEQRVTVEVLDRRLRPRAAYRTTDRVSGDVALALGDVDGDEVLEVLLAYDGSTGAVGPGILRVESLRYGVDGGVARLTRAGARVIATKAPPGSLTLVAADYAGLGLAQVILGYYPRTRVAADRGLHLELYQLDRDLQIPAPAAETMLPAPHPGSYFAAQPGVFKLDPRNGFDLRRFQLAVAYASKREVIVRVIEVPSDLASLRPGPPFVAADNTVVDGLGPGLAVGNLIGLDTDPVEPRAQIALSVPLPGAGPPGRSFPRLLVAEVDNGSLEISEVYRRTMRSDEAGGLVFANPIIAYDKDGRSFYLGTPIHIVIPELIDPQYVIGEPPKHVDYLPTDPGDPTAPREVVNVSGYPSLYVELSDRQQTVLEHTSTDTASATLGLGASHTATATVGGDVKIVAVEASTKVKQALDYTTTSVTSDQNTRYEERRIEQTARTNEDDILVFNLRLVDVWRYPVLGLDMERSELFPYYELVIPGPLRAFVSGGRQQEWYGPRHSNNNILSYPRSADPRFPEDLGSFTTEGSAARVSALLNEGVVRSFAGNEQTMFLEWTERAGGTSTKSYEYNLGSSTDITVGFKAEANIKGVKIGGSYEATASLSHKSSWANSVVARREVSSARGIRLVQPAVGGATRRAYTYRTAVYVSGNGSLKVAHAVDPVGAAGGRAWWRSQYGKRPDPALNLPNRFTRTGGGEPVWQLTVGDAYFWLRGLRLTRAEKDPLTDEYDLLPGAVDEGERVRVVFALHNFSVGVPAAGVVAEVAYQRLDPRTFAPLGDVVPIGRTAPVDIAPLEVVSQSVTWDTSGLAGDGDEGGRPYRLIVTVDPDDAVPDEIHELGEPGGNNTGIWPWGTGLWVQRAGADTRAGREDAPGSTAVSLALADPPDGLPPATTHRGPMLELSISSDRPDPALRHLFIERPGAAAAPVTIVAARTLHGLPKGTVMLSIPTDPSALAPEGTRLRAWLSPGTGGGVGMTSRAVSVPAEALLPPARIAAKPAATIAARRPG